MFPLKKWERLLWTTIKTTGPTGEILQIKNIKTGKNETLSDIQGKQYRIQ